MEKPATTAKSLEQRLFKRRIIEKSLPSCTSDEFPPLSSLYNSLIQKEKQIDFRLVKKQLEIQESSFKLFKLKRNLKIFLTSFYTTEQQESSFSTGSTFEDDLVGFQPNQSIPSTGTTTTTTTFYWTLRIDGRLMDFPQSTKYPIRLPPTKKFSSFIKSIHAELDPTKYPNDGFIEWTKVHLSSDSDGFEIKRKLVVPESSPTPSTFSVPIKVYIQLDSSASSSHQYKLSAALAQVLNKPCDSKPQIIMGLWQYVKLHKLQDNDDRRVINCDPPLKSLFGNQDRISFAALPELILAHLSPLDPIELEYVIQLDNSKLESVQEGPSSEIEVEIEDWNRPKLPSLLASLATTKEITLLDQKINEVLFAIHKSTYKQQFMTKFSQDPATFINKWVVNQTRYLEDVIGNGTGGLPEEMLLGDFFNQEWVGDMITHYLSC